MISQQSETITIKSVICFSVALWAAPLLNVRSDNAESLHYNYSESEVYKLFAQPPGLHIISLFCVAFGPSIHFRDTLAVLIKLKYIISTP